MSGKSLKTFKKKKKGGGGGLVSSSTCDCNTHVDISIFPPARLSLVLIYVPTYLHIDSATDVYIYLVNYVSLFINCL